MMPQKLVVVTRKTRLEMLVERFGTQAQARFYIEHSGGDFYPYEREHTTYQAAVAQLRRSLQGLVKLQVIERAFLPNYSFAPDDLVLTIGIDGLVVNTAKYLHGQPLIAVNPDPEHIDGVLLPFAVDQAPAVVRRALRGEVVVRPLAMAEALLSDGQSLLALNDVFVGRQDHMSARYRIVQDGREEHHSSSGIIISTGVGATGWLSSLFNMADAMLAQFAPAGSQIPAGLSRPALAWESDQLVFVVREPFASKTSAAGLVCGVITPETPLQIESTMPSGGAIFSDGVMDDFVSFDAGLRATIGLASRKTRLVVG